MPHRMEIHPFTPNSFTGSFKALSKITIEVNTGKVYLRTLKKQESFIILLSQTGLVDMLGRVEKFIDIRRIFRFCGEYRK